MAPQRLPRTELPTDRLRLRAFTAADAEQVLIACTDPVTLRWLALPRPFTLELAREYCTAYSPRLYETGGACWAASCARTGRLAGSFDLKPRTPDVFEIGYWVAPWARGQGLATEAVRAITGWALRQQGARRIQLQAAVGNVASQLVAERAGFTPEGVLRDGLTRADGVTDAVVYGLTRADLDRADGPHPRFAPATVVSQRLELRPPRENDRAGLIELFNHPGSLRWLTTPRPYTAAEAERWITRSTPASRAMGTGIHWVIQSRSTDDAEATAGPDGFVGTVGLIRPVWEYGQVEVGYALHPAARGAGHATEAVRAATAWALAHPLLERVELVAAVENTASRRVAERAGYTLEGVKRLAGRTADGTRLDCALYAAVSTDPVAGAGSGPDSA